ncbi:MAG: Secretion system C-terminal sorting domain [Bacteroidota bacterium]|jgi:hypothetical protein
MNTRKFWFALLCCVVSYCGTKAQSISPATINSTGGTGTIGTNTYDFSVAEMAVVSTATYDNGVVTHGVLQPIVTIESLDDTELVRSMFNVYPNPADAALNVEAIGNAQLQGVSLYDAAGKLVYQASVATGNKSAKLSMAEFAAGTYYLSIASNKNSFGIKVVKP